MVNKIIEVEIYGSTKIKETLTPAQIKRREREASLGRFPDRVANRKGVGQARGCKPRPSTAK